MKLGTDTLGRDIFSNIHSNTIFTLNNNNNDVLSLRIKPAHWFEIIAGNIRDQVLFNLDDVAAGNYVNIFDVVHIALVWSNDGYGTDNGDTLRFYVNGELRASTKDTWDIKDSKLVYLKLGGGITQTEEIYDSKSSIVYENLKIYNYCKDSFDINVQDVENDILYLPENYIEISKDNVNFYGLGSDQLPLKFEQVSIDTSVPIYIRVNKTLGMKSFSNTAQLIIEWLTTV